ncbi:MAG TPA: GAF domain-containing protein, partial [Burkholderiales bacterium]|nr:GAF domain-containing protein [Burkholderiales bacterium]
MGEIEQGLKCLVDFLGFDRSSFAEFSPDGAELNILCSVVVNDVSPLPEGPFPYPFHWYLGKLRAGGIVVVTSPDDLPSEAAAEIDYCHRTGLRSHLGIPIRIGGRLMGVVGFAAFRSIRAWPEDVVARLKIVGEVLWQALARSRAETESRWLRAQLWHSDRVARVGALTSSIAHELNQPLTAILSNAQ